MFNSNLGPFLQEEGEDLNNFLESLKIDYSVFYRGIVVDNLDPDLKGRIKVRIPQIYGSDTSEDYYLPNSAIPWATCAISPASNDSGTFLPPNIGDTVFVAFEAGKPDLPMYFGGIYTVRSEDMYEGKTVASRKVFNEVFVPVIGDDLPLEVQSGTERVIYKSLKGAVIYIDDKDGSEKIVINDQNGQSIIMENLSGDFTKRRGTDLGVNSKSQIVITNGLGDSITLSQGKIHLKSSNIILESDNIVNVAETNYEDEITIANQILGEADSND